MKFGVVVFPGSNCDLDSYYLVKDVLCEEVIYLWHEDNLPLDIDGVILPGGFTYGDYLRPGAMARFSTIMNDIVEFARRGGFVLGICNGFQILVESGLLPGALMKNQHLKFICDHVYVRVENNNTPFTNACDKGEVLKIPVAHNEGNYFAPREDILSLQEDERILFRYSDYQGNVSQENNPNGSKNNIAGICNENKNVLGMMPHPERAGEKTLGSKDGLKIFHSILTYWREKHGSKKD